MDIITEKDFQPQPTLAKSRTVKFVNFSKTPFTWTWNKVPYTFLPGEENAKFMEVSIAVHFAKHLVNRELLARGRESDTSPKNPGENPYFMDLFKRCVIEIDQSAGPTDQTKLEQEAIDKNMRAQMAKKDGKTTKTTTKPSMDSKTAKIEAKEPTKDEVARMTGQSEHHPKLNNKPASKADEDFEIIEPDAEEDVE